jgi:hypothetical protein
MTARLMTPFCFASLLAAALMADSAFADSFQNASTASKDSAEASAELAASGVQLTMGAVAVPLAAVGAVTAGAGQAALEISEELWEGANAPLTVSDEVLTAVPAPVLTQTGER